MLQHPKVANHKSLTQAEASVAVQEIDKNSSLAYMLVLRSQIYTKVDSIHLGRSIETPELAPAQILQ